MPTFTYKLRNNDGNADKGTILAQDRTEAITKLRRLPGVLLQVEEVGAQKGPKSTIRGGLSLKDRIVFTEQLAVMLRAGITLLQALKGLEEESTNKTLARILTQVVADVEGGMPFSDALTKYPKVFSGIYVQMVRSSEHTGNLSSILEKLTVQQQKEYELKGKVQGALIYPAIVSVLLVSVIILVITFILPKLTGLFAESSVSLPASTQFLLGVSYVFVNYWYILLGALAGLIVAFRFMVANPKGALIWDAVVLRIPILGSFIQKAIIARFAQTFASLSEAGIPVLEIFSILKGVVGNAVYVLEIEKITRDVENGIKVSVAIRKSKYFPGMVGQLVSVGEQSGDLAGIFTVLGDFFEKEVDSMAKNLSTLLEPIIMIVMGVVIGFVLISVLQPIYALVNAV